MTETVELHVGDLVEYHGSHEEYHGSYVVTALPLLGEDRGYHLDFVKPEYRRTSGVPILWNVHRRSLSLLSSAP